MHGLVQAMVDVVVNQCPLCVGDRPLYRLKLLSDFEATSVPFQHGDDALQVSLGPLEALEHVWMSGVNRHDLHPIRGDSNFRWQGRFCGATISSFPLWSLVRGQCQLLQRFRACRDGRRLPGLLTPAPGLCASLAAAHPRLARTECARCWAIDPKSDSRRVLPPGVSTALAGCDAPCVRAYHGRTPLWPMARLQCALRQLGRYQPWTTRSCDGPRP